MTSKTHNQTGLTLREGVRGEKACRNLAALLSSFLLAFVFASIFTPISTSSAAEVQQTVNYNNSINGYSLSFTSTGTLNVSMDAVPAGNYKAVSDTLTTKTNVPSGYKLSISTEDNSIYNVDDIDKVSTHLSPVSSTYPAETTLNNNQWGFKVASVDEVPAADTTWSAVPTTATKIKEYTSPTPDAGDTTTVSYGFRANTALPAGTYSTTITYTVYAENAEEFPYMQDFTTAECNAMQDNQITTLTDKRDGKAYRVTKMKDGNCWMSQNLAYDGGVMTPEDSNVTTTRDLSNAIMEDGTNVVSDTPYIYNIHQSETDTYGNIFGNLYSFNAATATVGKITGAQTVYESVCPKGWRLPDHGTEDGMKSWGNLLSSYTYIDDNGEEQYLPSGNVSSGIPASAFETLYKPPFSLPLSHMYWNTYRDDLNEYEAWSRTVTNSNGSIYHLVLAPDLDRIYNGHSNNNDTIRFYSVRCVFEGDTVQDNMYMQDVNLTMCANLAESTAESDNRRTVIDGRDGKTYRISHLADGNCWMVQNLALDGGTYLYPGSSNVTEKRDLTTAAIANGTTSEYDTPQIYASNATNYTSSCNSSYSYCIESTEPYGNLYNWNAATASVGLRETTDTIYESVCPAGWRLPDNGVSDDGDAIQIKSYSNLVKKYTVNLDGTGDYLAAVNVMGSDGGKMVLRVQQAPLYISLAGYYINRPFGQGAWPHIYTRTPYNATLVYNFHINANDGNFMPQHAQTDDKRFGFAIRCVLGE